MSGDGGLLLRRPAESAYATRNSPVAALGISRSRQLPRRRRQLAVGGILWKFRRGFKAASSFPLFSIALPERIRDIHRSDNSSFWDQGYPVLMVTDTSYPAQSPLPLRDGHAGHPRLSPPRPRDAGCCRRRGSTRRSLLDRLTFHRHGNDLVPRWTIRSGQRSVESGAVRLALPENRPVRDGNHRADMGALDVGVL